MNKQNKQKCLFIVLIVIGCILIVTGMVRLGMALFPSEGVSIIGGADTPTAWYWFWRMGTRIIVQILLGISCIFLGVFGLKDEDGND